jgi:hypothetical protein
VVLGIVVYFVLPKMRGSGARHQVK